MDGRMNVKGRKHPRPLGWRLKLAVAASLAVAMLAGCGQSIPSRTVENYFPLAMGNRWCWVQATEPADSLVFEIDSSYVMDGITFYRYPDPSGFFDGFWLVHWNGELRAYIGSPTDTSSREYTVLLKEPFDVGASWQPPNDSEETLRIIDRDVTLTVPAGTFKHCLQVESNVQGTYYYAPGVGWAAFPDTDEWVLLSYVTK